MYFRFLICIFFYCEWSWASFSMFKCVCVFFFFFCRTAYQSSLPIFLLGCQPFSLNLNALYTKELSAVSDMFCKNFSLSFYSRVFFGMYANFKFWIFNIFNYGFWILCLASIDFSIFQEIFPYFFWEGKIF